MLKSGSTARDALRRARELLAEAGIEDCELESLLLLTRALRVSRVQLYLDLDNQLTTEQSTAFIDLLQRRLRGEPAAYILGKREFYGLDFEVDSNVLIPRPETELLVDKASEIIREGGIRRIADVGTGSGVIAVSLAHKIEHSPSYQPGKIKIFAIDISPTALAVAANNCRKHGVSGEVCLLEGDLLEPLPETVDMIVANLPYVRDADMIGVNTVGFEPELALRGGKDGLNIIRRLCSQLEGKLRPGGSLLLEIGHGQGRPVMELLSKLNPSAVIECQADLADIERLVVMRSFSC